MSMGMAISRMGGAGTFRVMPVANSPKSATQKIADLFKKIDIANSGTVTKAQFKQAFHLINPPPTFKAMGVDIIFDRLDLKATGAISQQDFVYGMKVLMKEINQRSRQSIESVVTAPSQPPVLALSQQKESSLSLPSPPPPSNFVPEPEGLSAFRSAAMLNKLLSTQFEMPSIGSNIDFSV